MGTKRGGRKQKNGGGADGGATGGAGATGKPVVTIPNQRQKTVQNGNKIRTYFKVFACFKCSNDKCKKSWQSAHAWEREDDEGGIDCEICLKPAELVDAKDEMLKLDTYLCGCENFWQSIHVQENLTIPQECDICRNGVLPEAAPQERFGRHYWLKCLNSECPEKENVEWEDFSLTEQKTQRCTKCFSRGDIIKISKLRQLPPWLWRRRRQRDRKGEGDPDMEERPSNHVSEFCEMCQDIRRQGKGKNCRQWRLIKTKLETDENGAVQEQIVELNHQSKNPYHYNTKPKEDFIQVQK